jgi:hypothetical protein
MKERLAPLFFMPLAYQASEIRRFADTVAEDVERALKFWEHIERKEMEESAAAGIEFVPTENLERALRAWCVEMHKSNIVEQWEKLFKDVYIDLVTGKISLTDAEERVKVVSSFRLVGIFEHDPEMENIFKDWSSEWSPRKWKKRLDHLRKKETAEQEFKREMRKTEILSNITEE